MKTKIYRSKYAKLSGRSYIDVERAARKLHNNLASGTKRTPHIKSAYFDREKIFIDLFWSYLNRHPRPDGELFYVQVKQDVRSGNKHFMSVFRPN